MPGPRDDDDAPRWEPPAPSTEAPRWESTASDAPSWESTASEDTPRWDPDAEVPRWEPGEPAAWVPAVPAPTGPRLDRPDVVPRPATRPASKLAGPWRWWRRHPWLVLWALVFALPLVAVAMRLLDESEHQALVGPLGWSFAVLLGAALAVAAVVRWPRAAVRTALGIAGALGAAFVLLVPVTQVIFGRAPCPTRAGPELGAPVAAGALQAWREGDSGSGGWHDGLVDAGWSERAQAFRVLDYRLVETGCWERVAPVDGRRTWHEFRVTVQRPEDNPLSKIVIVHTMHGGEGWKITAIEGPLP
jgi:hypothetical protein